MLNDTPTGFEPVLAVRSLLSDLTVPWWVAGGWAIDLAIGQVTRPHDDVDVVLLERDEHALRGLSGLHFQLVVGPDPKNSRGRPLGGWWLALTASVSSPPSFPSRLKCFSARPSAQPGCTTGASQR
jgi:hypothetical protein